MTSPARPGAGLAFFAAVTVPAVLTPLGVAAVLMVRDGIGGSSELGLFVIAGFFVALVVIGLAASLIGLPLTAFLDASDLERPWSYQVAGAVAGTVLILALVFVLELPPSREGNLIQMVPIGLLPGFLSGEIWWRLNRRRR